jgi:hypothetical protein
MTQVEFNKHYKDFIKNYSSKYKAMDLNFDQVMKMYGVKDDEFKEKIKYVNAQSFYEVYSQVNNDQMGWVDEDNSDWDYSSDGKGRNDSDVGYYNDEYEY